MGSAAESQGEVGVKMDLLAERDELLHMNQQYVAEIERLKASWEGLSAMSKDAIAALEAEIERLQQALARADQLTREALRSGANEIERLRIELKAAQTGLGGLQETIERLDVELLRLQLDPANEAEIERLKDAVVYWKELAAGDEVERLRAENTLLSGSVGAKAGHIKFLEGEIERLKEPETFGSNNGSG